MSTILITIKTLQQQTFQIEFDVTQTVRQLKEKIEEERGRDYPADGQLLIYGGVMLENSRTVASYNVEERKFVVLMLQKQRQASKDAAQSTANPSTATASDVTTSDSTSAELTKEAAKMSIGQQSDAAAVPIDDTTAQQQPTPSDATSSSGPPLSAQQAAESRLLMGDEYNKMVDNLVEMGYSLTEVHKALQASYNNPERAVEYLVSGIPEDAAGVLEGSIGDTPEDSPGDFIRVPHNTPRDGRSDPLDFLRQQPQFHQMRYLIQQNPSFLHALLQQVGQSNPALLRLISENQETFVNMLNEPYDPDNHPAATMAPGVLQSGGAGGDTGATDERSQPQGGEGGGGAGDSEEVGGGGGGGGGGGAGAGDTGANAPAVANPSEANPYNLTPEDVAAIERLKELGFSEQEVIEAYLACGKNENVAANFLFS